MLVKLRPPLQKLWKSFQTMEDSQDYLLVIIQLVQKLQNGLASGFPELGKSGAGGVIAACGLDENVRGETLDIGQFAAIANEICRRKQNG